MKQLLFLSLYSVLKGECPSLVFCKNQHMLHMEYICRTSNSGKCSPRNQGFSCTVSGFAYTCFFPRTPVSPCPHRQNERHVGTKGVWHRQAHDRPRTARTRLLARLGTCRPYNTLRPNSTTDSSITALNIARVINLYYIYLCTKPMQPPLRSGS
jgi:hypothetical protein